MLIEKKLKMFRSLETFKYYYSAFPILLYRKYFIKILIKVFWYSAELYKIKFYSCLIKIFQLCLSPSGYAFLKTIKIVKVIKNMRITKSAHELNFFVNIYLQ